MNRPVLVAHSERITNAPLAVVAAHLMDPDAWSKWAPIPWKAVIQAEQPGPGDARVVYLHRTRWGLTITGTLQAQEEEGRVLLTHQARVSGWLIILLMGYYRWRIEGVWPRFVAALPQPGNHS